MTTVEERFIFIPKKIYNADRFSNRPSLSTVTMMIEGKPMEGHVVKPLPMEPQPDGTFTVTLTTTTTVPELFKTDGRTTADKKKTKTDGRTAADQMQHKTDGRTATD